MRRVVVTGLGLVSPLGHDTDSLFDALLACRPGIRRLDAAWSGPARHPVYAGQPQVDLDAAFPRAKRIGHDRVTMLAVLAARQARDAAALPLEGEAAERTGLYWGTGMGGAHTLEASYRDLLIGHAAKLRPSTIVAAMTNGGTGQIGIDLGLRGPSMTYSSACSSSAAAIGEAFRAIRAGGVDAAIAGGAEALLTEGVVLAWESLGSIARLDPTRPETSCRPFAADRSGFLLGEGAAAVVLEEEGAARARGATILGELVGYGNTTDASHITQPDPDGQSRAMRLALAEARIAAGDVDYINAHGAGTPVGDQAEADSIRRVFGDAAGRILVSSTKALHGHLMGATGALEFIIALEAMRRRVAPPTAHLWQPDPKCGPACGLDFVPLEPRALPRADVVMSNSFGFGGNNAVLVARRHGA